LKLGNIEASGRTEGPTLAIRGRRAIAGCGWTYGAEDRCGRYEWRRQSGNRFDLWGLTGGKPDPKKEFVVLTGDSRGKFKRAQPLIPIGADGLKVAVGDLNGDKRTDIVVIAYDSYTVTDVPR